MEVYKSEPRRDRDRAERLRVGIADYAVGDETSVLSTSGLGSCVGVALYDSRAGVVGLAHAMLPEADDGDDVAKYADTAVRALVEEMEAEGASVSRMRAKLAGGSTMFEFSSADASIGDRNVESARRTLESLGIGVEAADVGGDHGRSLELRGDTGDLRVRSATVGEHVL